MLVVLPARVLMVLIEIAEDVGRDGDLTWHEAEAVAEARGIVQHSAASIMARRARDASAG